MRQKSHIVGVLFLAGLLVSAGVLWAQVRANVPLVVVPVNVRDGNGQLVTGLTKDDFTLSEDGRPHAISYFSIDPVPLSAAIVIDDGMGGNALLRLVPSLKIMTSGFTPDDEMIAFRYDHVVWKLSEFTQDPSAIQKAFHEIPRIAETRPPHGDPGDPIAAAPSWLRTIGGLISVGSNGPPAAGRPPTAADPPRRPPTSRLLHDAVFEAAEALQTRSVDRRKIIFIISDGQVSGANKRSLEKNNQFLLEHGIQVYAVAMDFALREGKLGVLDAYAKSSGGDVYGGGSTRDLEHAFTKITEQARNQYVLGYISDSRPGRIGIYRGIDVKTGKPGHRVTHRKGYLQLPLPR
jgi:VWFA-related protein